MLLAIIINYQPFFFSLPLSMGIVLNAGMVLNAYKQQQAGPGAHYMLVSMMVKGNK